MLFHCLWNNVTQLRSNRHFPPLIQKFSLHVNTISSILTLEFLQRYSTQLSLNLLFPLSPINMTTNHYVFSNVTPFWSDCHTSEPQCNAAVSCSRQWPETDACEANRPILARDSEVPFFFATTFYSRKKIACMQVRRRTSGGSGLTRIFRHRS